MVDTGSPRTDTRAQLQVTALALFRDRGYDGVTAMEIATAAGVSERTFFRHFASKDETLLGGHAERLARLDAALRARPPTESPIDSLRAAVAIVAADFQHAPEDLWFQLDLIARTPSLGWRHSQMQGDWERTIARFLRRRLRPPDEALRARLMAACAVAALRVALDDWHEEGGGDIDIAAVSDRALVLAANASDLGWRDAPARPETAARAG